MKGVRENISMCLCDNRMCMQPNRPPIASSASSNAKITGRLQNFHKHTHKIPAKNILKGNKNE